MLPTLITDTLVPPDRSQQADFHNPTETEVVIGILRQTATHLTEPTEVLFLKEVIGTRHHQTEMIDTHLKTEIIDILHRIGVIDSPHQIEVDFLRQIEVAEMIEAIDTHLIEVV